MMKKLITIMIMTCLAVCLVACTGGEESSTDESSTASSSEQSSDSKEDEGLHGIEFKVDEVRNDKTGNWRVSMINEGEFSVTDDARAYYKKYFKSDDEIHFIVNVANNTTTQYQMMNGALYITVKERVESEEHDADLLGSGSTLEEYVLYTDTGKLEELQ